jgi:hypothetical protein
MVSEAIDTSDPLPKEAQQALFYILED